MRIALCWDWNVAIQDLVDWSDGLHGALEQLAKQGHKITVFTTGTRHFFQHQNLDFIGYPITNREIIVDTARIHSDVILCWGSLDRPLWPMLSDLPQPKALFLAGGPTQHPNVELFDHIFIESSAYSADFPSSLQGKVSIAFGVDVSKFFHLPKTPKLFPALCPTSIVHHKRLELLPQGTLVVGRAEAPDLLPANVHYLPRVSAAVLRKLYNMSHWTIIPGGHASGGERTAVESLACGTPVIMAADHARLLSLVGPSGSTLVVEPSRETFSWAMSQPPGTYIGEGKGREWVTENLSHWHYTQRIQKWMDTLLKGEKHD